ncbi:hypothetical protein [Arcobacter sp. L]|uniref:hypothetical protein n=1 Tax=Arcobacter sp. L TaxID=944547 RepID=UPI000229651F|nr:hypothetical protein [Arcobacter sp. L]BAK73788.1 hypothetical protein ABLL_1913 [Arcobacter sp. L]
MFKKESLILSCSVLLFVGCGGGGGGSSTPTIQKYDLYSYSLNPSVLSEDKISVENNTFTIYADNVQTIKYVDATVYNKNSSNKINEYEFHNNTISTIDQYNQLIASKTVFAEFEILTDVIKYTYFYDNSVEVITRNVAIGEKIISETDTDGSVWTCNLNKHYDTINVKDTINSFFGKEYSTSTKTYNDVIEEICVDSVSDEVLHSFLAKDIGLIFQLNTETLTTGVKEERFLVVDSHVLLTK